MEQTELHSRQLLNVEISIDPFFSKHENGNKQWQSR